MGPPQVQSADEAAAIAGLDDEGRADDRTRTRPTGAPGTDYHVRWCGEGRQGFRSSSIDVTQHDDEIDHRSEFRDDRRDGRRHRFHDERPVVDRAVRDPVGPNADQSDQRIATGGDMGPRNERTVIERDVGDDGPQCPVTHRFVEHLPTEREVDGTQGHGVIRQRGHGTGHVTRLDAGIGFEVGVDVLRGEQKATTVDEERRSSSPLGRYDRRQPGDTAGGAGTSAAGCEFAVERRREEQRGEGRRGSFCEARRRQDEEPAENHRRILRHRQINAISNCHSRYLGKKVHASFHFEYILVEFLRLPWQVRPSMAVYHLYGLFLVCKLSLYTIPSNKLHCEKAATSLTERWGGEVGTK